MYQEIIMAGVGGQGVMVIGNLLAQAAFLENLQVTYLPLYGVEKRGGHAECTVVIAEEEIRSPIVWAPQAAIIMSKSALMKYEKRIKPEGLLMLNSCLLDPQEVARADLEIWGVPALEIAQNLGQERLANMILIGAFVEKTKVVRIENLISALPLIFEERYHSFIPLNESAIRQGAEFAKNYLRR
ncbi:MAG: 2-oxoacid:acceptor oxidoreductase family protein [Thermodesulfobacteriota bacterium]